jgi:hypothetical protein
MRRLLVVALAIVACSPATGTTAQESVPTPAPASTTTTVVLESTTSTALTTTTSLTAFGVTSAAFDEGESIPQVHTCDGSDVSPPLDIVGIPDGTESLVLVVDDPDAPLGTWDHWVEFDIAVESQSMEIAQATEPVGVQGVNSWNIPGYRGPCPPDGEEHGYHFTVHALDRLLNLPAGVDSAGVYEAMEGDVLDSVSLTGVYQRS